VLVPAGTLVETRTGTSSPSRSSCPQTSATSICAISTPVSDEVAAIAPPAGSGSAASPNTPQLSITTSAISKSRRPDGCRERTLRV
jgi:hypothetical protein